MKTHLQSLFLIILVILCVGLTAQDSQVIDSLKSSSLNEMTPQDQLSTLIHLMDSLYTSDPDLCLDYAFYALDIAEGEEDEKGIFTTKNKMAKIYWQKSEFKKSLDLANEVKIRSYNTAFKKEYADALIVISQIYTDLGDYDKSSEMSFEALKLFEELEDQKGISKALHRVGNIYFEQEKWEKSLEYNQQSLAISREINDLIGISRGLNNVAAVYGNMGEFENFENYIQQAIVINKKTGRKLWEGINYFNLAIINRENHFYDTAFYYYQKAELLFLEVNNITKLSAINTHFSKYYEELGDMDKSLLFANKAYQLAADNQTKRPIHIAAMRLHHVYLSNDNIDSAYKYSQIQSQMEDSLNLEKSMNRLLQLELLYEFKKQEQAREIEKERTQFYYIISAIIIITFFILVIIILIARHRLKVKTAIIKRKELENEIDSKNKELTSNVMSLMRKNEILSEIADKLLKVRDDAVKDETKVAIKKIASELEQSNDKEIWEEFEVRFQQVHSDFYENLLQKYPDLSPSEQKLCAFLRLNMTTKEISELTGQRTNSLEIARARLRKKLGITNTKENLVSFLSRI